jgi:hypothetical protein
MKAVNGLRQATLTGLLESLEDIPAVVVDNKAYSFAYTNTAFEQVCKPEQHKDFLETVRKASAEVQEIAGAAFAVGEEASGNQSRRYSESKQSCTSVQWGGQRIRIAWEESIEGDPGHEHSSHGWSRAERLIDSQLKESASIPCHLLWPPYIRSYP